MLECITGYSSVNKIVKVHINYDEESIIEIPSLYGSYYINLSGSIQYLRSTVRLFNSLGVVRNITSPEEIEAFVNVCTKLGVIINNLELDLGEGLTFNTVIKTHHPKYDTDPEQISLFFQLSVSREEDIPFLLPELVESMTGLLMMFNHRLKDSGMCLN